MLRRLFFEDRCLAELQGKEMEVESELGKKKVLFSLFLLLNLDFKLS